MEKDQALREVQEIKQVMDNSRKRHSRNNIWWGIVLIALAVVVSVIMPLLMPVVAIGLLVSGIIIYRGDNEQPLKSIAAGFIAVGASMILLTLLVVLALMPYPYHSSLAVIESEPILVCPEIDVLP
jgi:predicted nucleic acid-binding Zn ribbon protein